MSVPRRVYFLFVQSVILFTFCDGKSPLLCFFCAFQPPKLNQSYPISRHQLFRGSLETCSKVDDFPVFFCWQIYVKIGWWDVMALCGKRRWPRTPSLKVTWHFPLDPKCPWKMKVFKTPNIWVITPKNEGFGFPWLTLDGWNTNFFFGARPYFQDRLLLVLGTVFLQPMLLLKTKKK